MDRVISLLAALVGLIALGGALLVQINGETQRQQLAADMAQLKLQIGLMSPQSASEITAATQLQPPAAQVAAKEDDGTTEALAALQSRIAVLERTTQNQAVELEAAKSALAAAPVAPAVAGETQVAALEAPAAADTPAAVTADGPTTDCIPLGTRFMAAAGDSFPICKTKAVVKVSDVSDGTVTVNGPGMVVAGAVASLNEKGCEVMVFSADISGYAEMRVSCK